MNKVNSFPENYDSSGVGSRAQIGIFWTSSNQVVWHGINAIVTIILVRLITPDTFALVGVSMAIVAFFRLFVKTGLITSLIQLNRMQKEVFEAAITFNLLIAFSLGFVATIGGKFVGKLMGYDNLSIIVIGFSIAMIISTYTETIKVIWIRKMDFKGLFFIETSAAVLAGIIAIITAYLRFGAWSFVFKAGCGGIISLLYIMIFTNYRIRFNINYKLMKPLMSFSFSIILISILFYLRTQFDKILVGIYYPREIVGYYTFASVWLWMPFSIISGAIIRVGLPSLCSLSGNKEKISYGISEIVKMFIKWIVPLSMTIYLIVDQLVLYLVGEKWQNSVELIKVFILMIMPHTLFSIATIIFRFNDMTWIDLKMNYIYSLVLCVLVFITAFYQLDTYYLVWMQFVVTLIFSVMIFIISIRTLNISFVKLLSTIVEEILVIASILFVTIIVFYMVSILGDLIQLIVTLTCGVGATLLLNRKQLVHYLRKI